MNSRLLVPKSSSHSKLRALSRYKNPRAALLALGRSPRLGTAQPIYRLSLCVLCLLCAFALKAQEAGTPRRPNVLFIVTDDQRQDTIAAFGNPRIQTPNLDGLVRRGTSFLRGSCAHPLCYPSRAEMLTGCTGFRSGTYSELKLNPGIPLWPQVMKDAGYRTCYVGKWHTAGRPSKIGYVETDGLYAGGGGRANAAAYVDFRGRPATGYGGWVLQTDDGQKFPEKGVGLTPNISSEFADSAIRLIKKKSDQPFFIHVNFTAPHDPRIWPPGYETRYQASQMVLPVNFRPEHPFDHGNIRGRDELLLPFPRTEDDVRQELACYYAVISHMDEQIGRIFQALDDTRQRDNTLIIFTADHGLAIGSHGLVGKQNMYEHTINVPLILAGPGIPAGQRSTAQCYLRDLFPTICDLVGLNAPEVDGQSLLPVIRAPSFNPEPTAKATPTEIYPYTIGYFQNSQRMIREENRKLVWYPQINRWQLFDLAQDPNELSDLIDEVGQGRRIDDLRGKLISWLKNHGDPVAAASQY